MAVNISLICKTDLLYSQFSILELPKTTGGKTHIKADLEVLDILKVGIKELLVLQTMKIYAEFNFQACFNGSWGLLVLCVIYKCLLAL